MSTGESTKAVVAALAANVGIALSKLVAFAVTGSGSMLAESAHSLADCGNQGLLLWGNRRAARAPDSSHPFGHARETYFSAFIVAVVLFTAGAGFAVREGLHKLSHPEPISSPAVAISVLIVALFLEGFSFRTAVRAAKPMRAGRSWWTFVRENKTAELTVILLEDAAALVGLAVALAGVGISAATRSPRWDAYGTLAIGGLLGLVAAILAVETKSLLIGESVAAETEAAIRSALDRTPEFRAIVHLRTEHRGPSEILVAAKVAVDPNEEAATLAAAIDAAEEQIRAAVPEARYIFIEPDIARPGP